jgi:hypothetical protein
MTMSDQKANILILNVRYPNSTINGSRQTMANAGRPAVTN